MQKSSIFFGVDADNYCNEAAFAQAIRDPICRRDAGRRRILLARRMYNGQDIIEKRGTNDNDDGPKGLEVEG